MTELSKIYRCRNGRAVVIALDDLGETIVIKDEFKKTVGEIHLTYIDDGFNTYYRLTWMYMDLLDSSYKRNGIGREALQFHREAFGYPIQVAQHDGI